jgi:transcriptional regulator with XRE-family HTH domain
MASKRQTRSEQGGIAELRKAAGAWLREKREAAGLSQRVLAQKLGIDYYTFISQIESGRGKVPSDRHEDYAEALGVDAREFALTMLRYCEPELYRMIFEDAVDTKPVVEPAAKPVAGVQSIEERLRVLEAKLAQGNRT